MVVYEEPLGKAIITRNLNRTGFVGILPPKREQRTADFGSRAGCFAFGL